MERKIQVGILGGTGMVGQHFVKFLQNHPWFDLTWLGASDRSAGKKYRDAAQWHLGGETPASVADIVVEECKPGNAPQLVFSATDAGVATEIEQAFAKAGHVVVSNSRNHRMEAGRAAAGSGDQPGPPEAHPDPAAPRAAGREPIVTNPNCSTVVLTMGLAPLKPFGITRVVATTMQAISGAGYPGVPSMDILGNVIPFIGGEEEKMQQETQKILGDFDGRRIVDLRRQDERALQPRAGGRRSHRHHFGGALLQARRGRRARGVPRLHQRAAGAPTARARRRGRSSTCRSRTARSRARTSSASAAWPFSSAACGRARSSTISSWPWGTIPCAAPPAPPC